jgi:hypothetical protein
MASYLQPERREKLFQVVHTVDAGSGKTAQKRSIVQVSSSSPVPEEVVKQALVHIANDFTTTPSTTLQAITITHYDEATRQVSYRLTGTTTIKTVTLTPPAGLAGTPISPIQVEIIPSFSSTVTATRLGFIGKEWDKLLPASGWSRGFAMLGLGIASLVTVFVLPAVMVGRGLYFYEERVAKKKEELEALLGSKLPTGPDAMIETLAAMQNTVKWSSRGQPLPPLYNLLGLGIANARNLQSCAKGTLERADFVGNILEQVERATEANPVLLPCGFYQGEDYQPAFLVMHKDGSQYVVKKYILMAGGVFQLDKVEVSQTFTFDKAENFEKSLHYLVDLQHPVFLESSRLTEAQKRQIPVLGGRTARPSEEHLLSREAAVEADLIADGLLTFDAHLISLSEEVSHLSRELAKAKRHKVKAEAELGKLGPEIERLQRALEEASSHTAPALAKKERLESEAADVRREGERLLAEVVRLTAEATAASRAGNTELQRSLGEQLMGAQALSKEHQPEVKRVTDLLGKAITDFDANRGLIARLNKELDKARADQIKNRDEAARLDPEIKRLSRELEQATARRDRHEAASPPKLKAPSKDPMSLLAAFFEDIPQAQSVGFGEKTQFFLHILNETTRSLLKYSDSLPAHKRELYFTNLAERLVKMETILRNAYGLEGARAIIGPLQKRIAIHKKLAVKKYVAAREAGKAEALARTPAQTPLQLSWKATTEAATAVTARTEEPQLPGIRSAQEMLWRLRELAQETTPSADQAAEILTRSRALVDLGETLLDGKSYSQARIAANAFLRATPTLDQRDFFRNFTDDQLKEYSALLTNSSKQIFESKFRLGQPSCSSEEVVFLFSARCLLVRINDVKLERLKAHVIGQAQAYVGHLSAAEAASFLTQVFYPEPHEAEWRPDDKKWEELFFSGFKYNPMTLDRIKRLGWVAGKVGLSEADCRTLSTLYFIPDLKQCFEVISQDYSLSPSSDGAMTERLEAIRSFCQDALGEFSTSATKRQATPKIIRLDASYLRKDEDIKINNDEYFLNLQALMAGYRERDNPLSLASSHLDDGFKDACLRQLERDDTLPLPDSVVDWRQEEFYTQCALHPEHSLYLAFDSAEAAGLWFSAARVRATAGLEDLTDEVAVTQGIQAVQQADLRERLAKIQGRLQIQIQDSLIDPRSPCIRVFGADPSPTDAKSGFYYYPWDLPGDAARFTPPANLNIHGRLLGPLPEELASTTSDGGINLSEGYFSSQVPPKRTLLPFRSYVEAKDSAMTPLGPYYESALASMLSARSSDCVYAALEFVLQNPHLLENDLVQARVRQVLFFSTFLHHRINSNPGYFANLIPELEALLQDAAKNGKVKRVSFLLYLTSHIQEVAKRVQGRWDPLDRIWLSSHGSLPWNISEMLREGSDDPMLLAYIEDQKTALQTIVDSMPTFSSELAFTPASGEAVAVPAKTWVLQSLARHLDSPNVTKSGLFLLESLTPEDITAMSSEELHSVLSIWHKIKQNAFSSKFPGLLEKVTQHIEEDLMSTILHAASTKWEAVSGQEHVYRSPRISGKDPLQVNVQTGELQQIKLGRKGAVEEDFSFDLPEEVVTDPYYVQVFGAKAFKCDYENTGTHEVFTFKVGERMFKVEKNIATKTVSRISQTIGRETFTHVKTLCREDANLGVLFQDKGIWIQDSHPSTALLIIPSFDSWTTSRELLSDRRNLRLTLSATQQVTGIHTVDGKMVVQDSTRQYVPWLPVTHEGNIVLLKSPDGDRVDEIFFIDTKFSLIKSEDAWVPSGKGAGWQCQMTGTKWLLDRFGESHEEFILPLVRNPGTDKQELELRIWPHSIVPGTPEDRKAKKVAFVKFPPGHPLARQLTVSIDAEHQMRSSHAGFLYLAYHSFARGDLDQASYYLEQLKGKNAIYDRSEVALLDYLSEQLLMQPAPTTRAKAFLLKAELTLSKIKREQFKKPLYEASQWQSLHEKMERLVSLYEAYTDEASHPLKQEKLARSNLLLTAEEREELDLMKSHFIREVVRLAPSRSTVSRPMPYSLERPLTRGDMQQFLPYMVLLSQAPDPTATFSSLQAHGISLTAEEMLGKFWTYWKVIVEGRITPDQLAVLMGPIPHYMEMDPITASNIDFARRMLLTLSQLVQKKGYDLTTLPLPPAAAFENVSTLSTAYRLMQIQRAQQRGTPVPAFAGRTFLEEPAQPAPNAGWIQKRWDALKQLAHGATLDMVLGHFEGSFEELLTAAQESLGEEGRTISLRTAPFAEAEGEVSIEEFEEALEKDTSLSPEERQSYLDAVATLKEDRDTGRPLVEVLSRLHQVDVQVTRKRHEQMLMERTRRLESAPSSRASFSALEVDLSLLEEENKRTLDATNWRRCCAHSLFQPTESDLAVLAEHFHRNPRAFASFLTQYESIRQAASLEELSAFSIRTAISGTDSIKNWMLYAAAQIREQELSSPSRPTALESSDSFRPARSERDPAHFIFNAISRLNTAFAKIEQTREIGFIDRQKEKLQSEFPDEATLDTQIAAMQAQLEAMRASVAEDSVLGTLERDLALLKESRADPMKMLEHRRMREGIETAAEERVTLVKKSLAHVFTQREAAAYVSHLQRRVSELSADVESIRHNVVSRLERHAGALGLYLQYAGIETLSEEAIFNSILDLYQDGALDKISDAADREYIETAITEFLFKSVKLQLFEKAIEDDAGSFAQLKAISAQIAPLSEALSTAHRQLAAAKLADQSRLQARVVQLEEKLLDLQIEWKAVSGEIIKKVTRASDFTFFSSDSEHPHLDDQAVSRPMLVFSYRQKIGITREQVATINKLMAHPDTLEELRMGLGKSSVIFPLVARLLADRGAFVTVIFTEELVEQSRKDMDKRAYEFKFQRSPDLTAEQLAEEYETLLEVKAAKKYVITTSNRLAALENKFHEVNRRAADLKASYNKVIEEMEALPEDSPDRERLRVKSEQLFSTLVELETKKHWIRKIYFIFDPDVANARFLVDEADEVFHISSEQNYSSGLSENVDALTFDVGEKLFHLIFTATTPALVRLRDSFLHNTQSTLSDSDIGSAVQELSRALWNDPDFISRSGIDKASVDEEAFVNYLSSLLVGGVPSPLPPGMPALPSDLTAVSSTDSFAYVGAYRHWLSKTLPTLCRKRLGIDFDISRDGFTVTPRKEEREKPNTKFGQEAEMTGYHFLTYYCKAPSEDFFMQLLPEIEAKAAGAKEGSRWKDWLDFLKQDVADLSPENLYARFSADNEAGRNLRAGFLRFVMQEGEYIQIHREQISCRVQDLIASRKVAGASGTMNRYALPFPRTDAAAGDPRLVTGDLLMRLSMMDPRGLEADVTVFSDSMAQMTQLLGDKRCKAIINLGTTFPGKTTKDVIAELRTTPQGRQRQFIFIDPKEKTAYFWDVGSREPRPFDKVRDAKLVNPEICVYYFAPADIRGTDFKIPSGYGALITGPTTTLPLLEQAIWRLRKLGMGHSVRSFIEEALADRIRRAQGTADIKLGHVFRDIVSKTMEEESLLNFKAQTARPQSIWTKHVKQMLFRPLDDDVIDWRRPDMREQALTKMEAERQLFDVTRPLFFAEKRMNYLADYTPSEMQPTTDYIEGAYERQLVVLERDFTTAFTRLEEAYRTERTSYFTPTLVQAKEELDAALDDFTRHKEDYHRPHLRAAVAKNVSLDAGSESEVEQQQEQQTEQQTEQAIEASYSTPPRRRKEASYQEDFARPFQSDIMSTLNRPLEGGIPGQPTNLSDYGGKRASALFPDCGLSENLVLSDSFVQLFIRVPLQGKALAPLMVYLVAPLSGEMRTRLKGLQETQEHDKAALERKKRELEALEAAGDTSAEGIAALEEAKRFALNQEGFVRDRDQEILDLTTALAAQEDKEKSTPPEYTAAFLSPYDTHAGFEYLEERRVTGSERFIGGACYSFRYKEPYRQELFSFGDIPLQEDAYLLMGQAKLILGFAEHNYAPEELDALGKWFKGLEAETQTNLISTLRLKMASNTANMLAGWQTSVTAPTRAVGTKTAVTAEPRAARKTAEAASTHAVSASGAVTRGRFILDAGGGGDCAAHALAHQLSQKGERAFTHGNLRKAGSDYLSVHASVLARDPEWMAMVVSSLNEALIDTRRLPDNEIATGREIERILAQHPAIKQQADKIKIIQYYAKYTAREGVWLDKPFFAALSKHLHMPIAIVKHDPTNRTFPYVLEENWPHEPIDPDKCLFIYYNASSRIPNVRGYHFQSINRDRIDLIHTLIANRKAQAIRDFCKSCAEQKPKGDTAALRAEKISGLSRYVDDLRHHDPDALSAVVRILNNNVLEATASLDTFPASEDELLLLLDDRIYPKLTIDAITAQSRFESIEAFSHSCREQKTNPIEATKIAELRAQARLLQERSPGAFAAVMQVLVEKAPSHSRAYVTEENLFTQDQLTLALVRDDVLSELSYDRLRERMQKPALDTFCRECTAQRDNLDATAKIAHLRQHITELKTNYPEAYLAVIDILRHRVPDAVVPITADTFPANNDHLLLLVDDRVFFDLTSDSILRKRKAPYVEEFRAACQQLHDRASADRADNIRILRKQIEQLKDRHPEALSKVIETLNTQIPAASARTEASLSDDDTILLLLDDRVLPALHENLQLFSSFKTRVVVRDPAAPAMTLRGNHPSFGEAWSTDQVMRKVGDFWIWEQDLPVSPAFEYKIMKGEAWETGHNHSLAREQQQIIVPVFLFNF